jgi:hypothetical protein
MIRGIEHRKIFNDDKDRENFVGRLSVSCAVQRGENMAKAMDYHLEPSDI